jgi:hypothetical protein
MGFMEDFASGFIPSYERGIAEERRRRAQEEADRKMAERLAEERAYQDERDRRQEQISLKAYLLQKDDGMVDWDSLKRDDILGSHDVQGPLSAESLERVRDNPLSYADVGMAAGGAARREREREEAAALRAFDQQKELLAYGSGLNMDEIRLRAALEDAPDDTGFTEYNKQVKEYVSTGLMQLAFEYPDIANAAEYEQVDPKRKMEYGAAQRALVEEAREKFLPLLSPEWQVAMRPLDNGSVEDYVQGVLANYKADKRLDEFNTMEPEHQQMFIEMLGFDPRRGVGRVSGENWRSLPQLLASDVTAREDSVARARALESEVREMEAAMAMIPSGSSRRQEMLMAILEKRREIEAARRAGGLPPSARALPDTLSPDSQWGRK